MIDIWYNDRREGERMARERFSFDDTIEFDKDELKPNNDIHANHTGKFTFDDEVKEKSNYCNNK